ncbi:MAG: hypothetical protein R3C68_01310 [Myxococcota bacterium]
MLEARGFGVLLDFGDVVAALLFALDAGGMVLAFLRVFCEPLVD